VPDQGVLTLPTKAKHGSIQLREARDPGVCVGGCGARGGGLAVLTVHNEDGSTPFMVCGSCLSGALAIVIDGNIEGKLQAIREAARA